MWASAAVLSTHHRMEVWHVDAERISARKIYKAIISLTLRKNVKMLLT
jgi:hypothetical protein